MLAQNFMSAKDLRLEDKQHAALVTVLGMLERGEVRHVRAEQINSAPRDNLGLINFNMGVWASEYECGTVMCMGGLAERVGRLPVRSLDMPSYQNKAVRELLYPPNLNKRTPADAARALRAYLTTGEPDWS